MAGAKLPGELAERYEWVAELGRGAMGVVHRVRDRKLGRDLALKLIGRRLLADPSKRKRFEREARVLARVEHPGVVRLFDFGVAEGLPFMAMELLHGRDLQDAAGLDPVAVMREAAAALEAVHAAGVLHRDLKPANLMRLEDGRVVLVDFGLAHADEESDITRSGDVVGSPYYMAPEVLCGRPATPSSDFYSWGVTLYHLLEGRTPFDPESFHPYAIGQRELELAPRRVAADGPEMAAVRACMSRDPDARPTSLAALDALLRGEAETSGAGESATVVTPARAAAPLAPSLPPPRPPPGRGPGRVLLVAGALGLLLGALAGRRPAGSPPFVPESAQPAAPATPGPELELARSWERWREASTALLGQLGLERDEVVDHLPALVEWTEVQRLAPTLAKDAFLARFDGLRREVGGWFAAATKASPAARARQGPPADPLPTELLRYLFRLAYEADLRMDMALLELVGQAGYTPGEHLLREDWGARKLALRDLAEEVVAEVARLEDPAPGLLRLRLAAVALTPDAPAGPVADSARARLAEAPPAPEHVMDALALDMLGTQRFEARALACGDRAAIQATMLDFEARVRAAGPSEPALMLTGRVLENEVRMARLCGDRWEPARMAVVEELYRALVARGEAYPDTYAVILRDLYTTGRGNVPVFGPAPPEVSGTIDDVIRRYGAIPGQEPLEEFPLGEL